MNNLKTDPIQLPVGRFVSGSLHELRKTDLDNRPLKEEEYRYEFGLAIRKDDPSIGEILQKIQAFAYNAYANVPAIQQLISNWAMDGFSWKFADGDAPSKKTGKVNENTAGCWVFYFRTGAQYPFRCVQWDGTTHQDVDPALIKRGYYVDALITATPNGETAVDRAGLYLNCNMVRFIQKGEEIKGGLNADEHMTAPPQAAPMLGSEAPSAPSVGLPGAAGAPQQPQGLPGAAGAPPATGFAAGPGGGLPGVN